MKYGDLAPAPKLTVRRAGAIAMLEHAGYLERFIALGWVRSLPPVDCHTFTVTLHQKETANNRHLQREQMVEPRGFEPLTSSMPLRVGYSVVSHF